MEEMDLNRNEGTGGKNPRKVLKLSKVLFGCGVQGSNKPFGKFKWNWKYDKLDSGLCWNNQNQWTTLIFTEGDWVSVVTFLHQVLIDVSLLSPAFIIYCIHVILKSIFFQWHLLCYSSEAPVRIPVMTNHIQQLSVSHRTQRGMISHSKGALKLCSSKSWEGKSTWWFEGLLLSFLQHGISFPMICWELIRPPRASLFTVLHCYGLPQPAQAMPVNKLWKPYQYSFKI